MYHIIQIDDVSLQKIINSLHENINMIDECIINIKLGLNDNLNDETFISKYYKIRIIITNNFIAFVNGIKSNICKEHYDKSISIVDKYIDELKFKLKCWIVK